ncbi:MAG TPA: GNAT family N-acetyltransferase [Candidatus Dormibacteraeota bacterium]
MGEPVVELLEERDFGLVKPLLVQLYLSEQPHFTDHPQLTESELVEGMDEIQPRFSGDNLILAVRDGDRLAGFCWCVFFDPGTGLEGEVAEVFVDPSQRGRGIARALLRTAVKVFRDRGVTLGYVWTRPDNDAAIRLYRSAGFRDNRQLVLTWYPHQLDSGQANGPD